ELRLVNAIPNGSAQTEGVDVGPLRHPSRATSYTSLRPVSFSVTTKNRPCGSSWTWAGLGWAELSGRVEPAIGCSPPRSSTRKPVTLAADGLALAAFKTYSSPWLEVRLTGPDPPDGKT